MRLAKARAAVDAQLGIRVPLFTPWLVIVVETELKLVIRVPPCVGRVSAPLARARAAMKFRVVALVFRSAHLAEIHVAARH